jgi:hypothetical protein
VLKQYDAVRNVSDGLPGRAEARRLLGLVSRFIEACARWATGGWKDADPPFKRLLGEAALLVFGGQLGVDEKRQLETELISFLQRSVGAGHTANSWLKEFRDALINPWRHRARSRTENWDVIDEMITRTDQASPSGDMTLEHFGGRIEGSGRINLSTLHSAKGREFSYRDFRVWPEQLAEMASRSVMLFRGWMLKDLERAGALEGARVIWSQWEGYLKEGSGEQLKADCKSRDIPFEIIHTSGHASIIDLQRLAAAVNPQALVPIHTFEPERFPDLFESVVLHQDGEWWEV